MITSKKKKERQKIWQTTLNTLETSFYVFIAFLLLIIITTPAHATTYIDACGEINTSNTEYELNTSINSNITYDYDSCFTIGAENISLNCKGYTITNIGNTSIGAGIVNFRNDTLTYYNNVNVSNCNLKDFVNGLGLFGDNIRGYNINYSYNGTETTLSMLGVLFGSNFSFNNIDGDGGVLLMFSNGGNITDSYFNIDEVLTIGLIGSSGNYFINNTFTGTVEIDEDSGGNYFSLNFFNNSDSLDDENGTNNYNMTIYGKNQGNAWYEVINGITNIYGIEHSSLYDEHGLYIGEDSYNAQIEGITAIDYKPLTYNHSLGECSVFVVPDDPVVNNCSINFTVEEPTYTNYTNGTITLTNYSNAFDINLTNWNTSSYGITNDSSFENKCFEVGKLWNETVDLRNITFYGIFSFTHLGSCDIDFKIYYLNKDDSWTQIYSSVLGSQPYSSPAIFNFTIGTDQYYSYYGGDVQDDRYNHYYSNFLQSGVITGNYGANSLNRYGTDAYLSKGYKLVACFDAYVTPYYTPVFTIYNFMTSGLGTCADNTSNGQENGVDCGGCCISCSDRCSNGVMDGDETGIDCGGTTCSSSCYSHVINSIEVNDTFIINGDSISLSANVTDGDNDIEWVDFSVTYPDSSIQWLGSTLIDGLYVSEPFTTTEAGEYLVEVLADDCVNSSNFSFTSVSSYDLHITVLDEETSVLITENVSLNIHQDNMSDDYSTITGYFNISNIYDGEYFLDFTSANYSESGYIVTINNYGTADIYLTARMLLNSSSVPVMVYTKDTQLVVIPDVLITIQRQYSEGSYATTTQSYTDDTGWAIFNVQEGINYRIILEKSGYTTKQFNQVFYYTLSPYTWIMTRTSYNLFTNIYMGVNYYYYPTNTMLNPGTYNFTLTTYNSTSTIAWTSVTANGTTVNVTGSSTGGTASINLTLPNTTSSYNVVYRFNYLDPNTGNYSTYSIPVTYNVNVHSAYNQTLIQSLEDLGEDIDNDVWLAILATFCMVVCVVIVIQLSGNTNAGLFAGLGAMIFFGLIGWLSLLMMSFCAVITVLMLYLNTRGG